MLNLSGIIIRRVLKLQLIPSHHKTSIKDRLANTKLTYQIEEQSDLIWIGIDVDETIADVEWDHIRDELERVGLEFTDPCIEHDYISGPIQLI